MKNKFSIALSIALIMAMLVTSLALADDMKNDVVSVPASITLTAGDAISFVDVQFWIQPTSNDSDQQCNFDSTSESLTFTINTPSGVTANPYSLTFNKCKDGGVLNAKSVRFSASASALSGNISFTETENTSGGTFNYSGAVFYVNVVTPPPSDLTAPSIGYTLTPASPDGDDGWYKSNVSLVWSVTDPESSVTKTDCVDQNITLDQAATTYSCSATSAGGTAGPVYVTIKRDATLPTISGSVSPAPNGAGWNKTDVAANFACDDNLSGMATCGPNQILVNEGANLSQSGTAVDNAGNSASFTLSGINIDKTVPTASASAAPAPNAKGWNNTDVTVSFSGSDSLSGIAACSNAVVLSAEDAGQSASGSCIDIAGNVSTPATASGINIDKTAPTASATVSPSANLEDWNNTPVTVSFSGGDGAGSGIDYCDAAVVLSGEGAGQSTSGACTDNAGNVSAVATASGINIDMTPPSVALLAGPEDGANYYFGFVPAPPTEQEIVVTDALSGPYKLEFTGYELGVGTHTMTVKAYDKAGNISTLARTYTVLAWTLNGFYKPVDMSGLIPVWNTVKGGSTVPLKFESFAGTTELTDTGYIQGFSATPVSCSFGLADAIEVTATGGTSLRYDSVAGQFIYNWQTPKSPGACYKITMTTQDGSSLSALFKLK